MAFLDPSGRASDEWNDRMIQAIAEEGTSLFSGTSWGGRRATRISVSKWQTSNDDVRRTVRGVERATKQMREAETLAT